MARARGGPTKNTIHVPGIGEISTDVFVFETVAKQLEHQLDRYRDIITLSVGAVAAALAGVAFMLADHPTTFDGWIAKALILGVLFAGGSLVYRSDPKDAPEAELVARLYADHSELTRGLATAAMLKAMRRNTQPLKVKMLLFQIALGIILISAVLGVPRKVVESGGSVRNSEGSPSQTSPAVRRVQSSGAVRPIW